jgi:methylated-DNA-protein-cysteine methyltransferase related protein
MYLNQNGLNYWSNVMNKATNRDNIYDVIYDIVRLCPKGRVTTYGAVATAAGAGTGARLVGYAMNNCAQVKPKVPAHRVVNRKGLLTGKHHFGTPTKMQELLEKEGVVVVDDQVRDFEHLFWNPLEELSM